MNLDMPIAWSLSASVMWIVAVMGYGVNIQLAFGLAVQVCWLFWTGRA